MRISTIPMLLLVFSVCAAAGGARAEEAEMLKGITYSCANRTFPNYPDATGSQLTDGVTAVSLKDAAGKSVNNTVIYEGGTVTIDVNLNGLCRISKVITFCHRHNMNYKLDHMIVLAEAQGQWVEVGRAPGFWGDTAEKDFEIAASGFSATTPCLRLQFITPSILSISEIQVFGKRLEAEPSAAAARYGEGIPLSDSPKASAREADADGDGQKEVILENRFVRLIFDPAKGGTGKSFLYKKTKKEFVFVPGGPKGLYGLLRDQLWSPQYFFAERPYLHRIENHEDRALVELWCAGAGGMMGFTEVRKTVTLTRDSSRVECRVEIKNDPSSQTDYEYGYWSHNWCGVFGERNTYFFPTTEGVKEYTYPHDAKPGVKDEEWYYNPARGWTGFASDGGTGLVALMEHKYLNCFYHWAGAGSLAPTWEWRLNRIKIASGSSLKTTFFLHPFAGLSGVDGAFAGLVGSIALPAECGRGAMIPAQVALHSAEARKITVVAKIRGIPDGGTNEVAKADLTFTPDETQRMDCLFHSFNAGTFALVCEVRDGDTVLGTFERPIVVGGAKVAYTVKPESERVGASGDETKPTLKGHDLSTEYETPHVQWAKPYAKGRIKALMLCDDREAREVVELWQRLDLDFTYVKFLVPDDDTGYLYHGDRSIQNLAQAKARLKEKLTENYDVIMLAGLKWDFHFDDAIRTSILDKVKAGVGLVYIAPMGVASDLAQATALPSGEKRYGGWERWATASPHYLTSALPFDAMPKTRFLIYASAGAGETLMTIGKDKTPLLMAGALGKGRVVCATYNPYTHDDFTYRGYPGFTPKLTHRSAVLNPMNADITFNYWEYYFALLARMAVWAGNKESGVEVRAVQVRPSASGKGREATIFIASPGGGMVVALILTSRDRFSNVVAETRKTVHLLKKEETVKVAFPPEARAGLNLVDVIVRDGADRSLAWGAGCFLNDDAIRLLGISWDKTDLDPGEPARGKISIQIPEAAREGKHDLKTRLDLYDSYGRLLATQTLAGGSDAETPRLFSFELHDLVVPGIEARGTLLDGEAVLDTASARALVKPKRDWDSLTFMSWSALYNWRSWYLFSHILERDRELGLDVSTGGIVEGAGGVSWLQKWYGMQLCCLGLLDWGPAAFRDKGFQEKSTAYAKSLDKKCLIREPCLNDPAYRAVVRKAALEAAEKVKASGGAHDFCMGDEMSLTHYTAYHDYCFGPHCLAKFRDRLKERYGSLDALNAEWETKFADWKDVVPMTAAEVQDRGNYAPWADHRTFMEDTLADFYSMIANALREVDPDAKAGLSGTQAPEAGNGQDWWKLSRAFNYYHSYNTEYSEEMRRSFKQGTGVMSSPYFAGYWLDGRRLEQRLWYCLLHDCQSISSWTTPLFFYPDLTFSESGRDTRDGIAELKSGIWDAIRAGKRLNDPIAIHFSMPSIHAAFILGKREEFDRTRKAWVQMLEDAGLQYDFVAYEEIEGGVMQKRPYRALILPQSMAMSAKETEAVRRFVRDGGLVIADSRPAIMDEHCRTLPSPALDDLFGVKHAALTGDSKIPDGVVLTRDIGRDLKRNAQLKLTAAEANVAAAPAEPFAESSSGLPVFMKSKAGKGRAVYLNLSLVQYEGDRKFHTPTERQMQALLLGALAEARIAPQVAVRFRSGAPPHCEIVRYGDGPVEYVGVLRDFEESAPDEVAEVRFGRKANVYDVRARRFLGKTDKVTAVLAAGQVKLYALLARPPGSIGLQIEPPGKPGDPVRYTVQLGPEKMERTRIVRVVVRKPTGEAFAPYGATLRVAPGQRTAQGRFRPALNDPLGRWQITATDVATGLFAQGAF